MLWYHQSYLNFYEIEIMFDRENCRAKNSEQTKIKMMHYCDLLLSLLLISKASQESRYLLAKKDIKIKTTKNLFDKI